MHHKQGNNNCVVIKSTHSMLKIRRGGERRDKLGVARDLLTDETCQSKKKDPDGWGT